MMGITISFDSTKNNDNNLPPGYPQQLDKQDWDTRKRPFLGIKFTNGGLNRLKAD